MNILDQLSEAERVYSRLPHHQSTIAEAEQALAKAELAVSQAKEALAAARSISEADFSFWRSFEHNNPTLKPIVEIKFAALAKAGYPLTESPGPATSPRPAAHPPSPIASPPDIQSNPVAVTPPASAPLSPPSQTPARETEDETTKASKKAKKIEEAPKSTIKIESPPGISAESSESPSEAPSETIAKVRKTPGPAPKTGNEKMIVGILNTVVPNRPPGSPSRKSNIDYKNIWAKNYQAAFDRAMEGLPCIPNDATGPSRDGYLTGYAHGLEYSKQQEDIDDSVSANTESGEDQKQNGAEKALDGASPEASIAANTSHQTDAGPDALDAFDGQATPVNSVVNTDLLDFDIEHGTKPAGD